MKVVALVINLIPYHVARWAAVAASGSHEVSVLQLQEQDEFQILETEASRAPSRVITLRRNPDDVRQLNVIAEMMDVLQSEAPDVVVINGYSFPMSLAMLVAAAKRRVPSVVCSESNKNDFKRQWLTEKIKERVVRLFGAGLVGGQPQREYLCELGLACDRVFQGYNAVDNAHFAHGADAARAIGERLRAEWRLPRRFFIAVARLTEKKSLDFLVRAFGQFVNGMEGEVFCHW